MTPKDRKDRPMATGFLDYFPDAMMEVAHLSKVGNDQHNPGQPLHWAKEKSQDHPDALLRHLKDRGTRDSDGERHSAKVAWRAMAMLQREIELERGDLMPKADFRQMTRDVLGDTGSARFDGEEVKGRGPMIRHTSEDRSLWRPMDRTNDRDGLQRPYPGDENVVRGGGTKAPDSDLVKFRKPLLADKFSGGPVIDGQAGGIAMQWSPEADKVIEPYPPEAPADTPLDATEPYDESDMKRIFDQTHD